MSIFPWYYRLLFVAGMVVVAYGFGRVHQMFIAENERNEIIVSSWEQGDKHVANYFKRTRELADRAVVADRANRLCLGQLRRAKRTDGIATPSAGDRRADAEGGAFTVDDLANDALACKANSIQLETLQDVIRPQLYNADKPWYDPRGWF
jgi:hypothetical protein